MLNLQGATFYCFFYTLIINYIYYRIDRIDW